LKQRVKKHREQDLKEIETSTNENWLNISPMKW
jgi:hypothetical protein